MWIDETDIIAFAVTGLLYGGAMLWNYLYDKRKAEELERLGPFYRP